MAILRNSYAGKKRQSFKIRLYTQSGACGFFRLFCIFFVDFASLSKINYAAAVNSPMIAVKTTAAAKSLQKDLRKRRKKPHAPLWV